MKIFHFFIIILWVGYSGCSSENSPKADLLLINTHIVTLQDSTTVAEALAIKDGKILAIGSTQEILAYKKDATRVIALPDRYVYPGFIEGHGHWIALGKSLSILDLNTATAWDSIVQQVRAKTAHTPAGQWIEGRGWHQEKWQVAPQPAYRGYPTHDALSKLTPEHPVILYHASGHALFANQKAMTMAGISKETKDPAGGFIVRDAAGNPTGIFEENAMEYITQAIAASESALPPEQRYAQWERHALAAQALCLANGITSFQDAGTKVADLAFFRRFKASGKQKLRLWLMLNDSLTLIEKAAVPIIDSTQQLLTVRAIKMYLDGALGSYGAWLLAPYTDKPNFYGQNTTPLDTLLRAAHIAKQKKMQLCTHAIGDKGNREVLNVYENVMGKQADARWRIEHAQHLAPADIPRFAQLGVIPSMQAIHCTSDAPFVEKRLGKLRAAQGAYVWKSLWDSGAILANGTDTPIESVNPIANIYSSVTRKNLAKKITFYPEQCLTPYQALRSITANNAYAAFEETAKGTISVGKLADLTIVNNNLLTGNAEKIQAAAIEMVIINGQVHYEKSK